MFDYWCMQLDGAGESQTELGTIEWRKLVKHGNILENNEFYRINLNKEMLQKAIDAQTLAYLSLIYLVIRKKRVNNGKRFCLSGNEGNFVLHF